jgi:hypothetical protein
MEIKVGDLIAQPAVYVKRDLMEQGYDGTVISIDFVRNKATVKTVSGEIKYIHASLPPLNQNQIRELQSQFSHAADFVGHLVEDGAFWDIGDLRAASMSIKLSCTCPFGVVPYARPPMRRFQTRKQPNTAPSTWCGSG